MEVFRWNALKNIELKIKHGVSFDEIVGCRIIDICRHPKRGNQELILFDYRGYVWAVPFVVGKGYWFLKTLYPSRKFNKIYKKEVSDEKKF